MIDGVSHVRGGDTIDHGGEIYRGLRVGLRRHDRAIATREQPEDRHSQKALHGSQGYYLKIRRARALRGPPLKVPSGPSRELRG
jgi:hypothetical protein